MIMHMYTMVFLLPYYYLHNMLFLMNVVYVHHLCCCTHCNLEHCMAVFHTLPPPPLRRDPWGRGYTYWTCTFLLYTYVHVHVCMQYGVHVCSVYCGSEWNFLKILWLFRTLFYSSFLFHCYIYIYLWLPPFFTMNFFYDELLLHHCNTCMSWKVCGMRVSYMF